jgi:hypothetical protein
MSAYICSPKHVGVLAATIRALCYGDFDEKKVAEVLMLQNIRSVTHRYPDASEADRPGPGDGIADNALVGLAKEAAHALYLKPPHFEIVELLKLSACLDYQSCETDDWKKTDAYKFLQQLDATLIRRLPGYDDAAWSI